MRKINLSNDVKRDAEVAFGTTFHRPSPVYKTADGKKSVNERRVRGTMTTTDEALLAQFGAEGLADALIAGDRQEFPLVSLAEETTIDDTEEPVEEEIDELDFSMF